jgi:hypothetical protein
VSDNSNSSIKLLTASSWNNFKMTSNGLSYDIRKSAAQIKSNVNNESKIFTNSSIYDGGTRKTDRK